MLQTSSYNVVYYTPAPRSCARSRVARRRWIKQQSRAVIERVVSQVFGVAGRELACPTRGRAAAAEARQVAMYLAHVGLGITLSDVGTLFGRDRTTVAHACALVEDRREDPRFDRSLDLLEWTIRTLLAA